MKKIKILWRCGRLGVAVRVVDERVEALVRPLPEHDC